MNACKDNINSFIHKSMTTVHVFEGPNNTRTNSFALISFLIMFYRLLSEFDFWIGGQLHKYDSLFTVDGKAEIYMRVPSVQTVIFQTEMHSMRNYFKVFYNY